ncbi:MAG: pantoate--beta-alanine ligase [Bacteroidetes bacterium GWF2_43_63]|nr:MAG: pantoate--beta-alanine ligase [Bacteroidetes bacterium GWE2_42_42]OFY53322.1 MAG: pantoate--beta-alanine ligase [Bacteroidetes bacterium GWF2_43_63]HBG71682.1 pantoate--beta-alanine ligase [Bacteroidales bacterium]HCB61653.1 pantoate--beta-alanine ligase [Bacteroidales bacterium]HCY22865.1 pantoate--beta-alanine ligase [Bacteroidales bacterium]
MNIFRTIKEYKDWRNGLTDKTTIGFVPTMGFLHQGHISLVSASLKENDETVVSIFVNPTQFNNPEDLVKYPRNEARDLAMLEKAGATAVFIPTVEEMYPEPVTRTFTFTGIDDVMEGAKRPGHFNGVAMVVSALFSIVGPNISYFGMKDYQQLLIIRKLAENDFPLINIKGMPIVREDDGLAMSSRNSRLSEEEREMAPLIYEVLKRSKQLIQEFQPDEVCRHCERMLAGSGMIEPEYFIIADAQTLQPLQKKEDAKHAMAFVAAWLGKVRLIDNFELF